MAINQIPGAPLGAQRLTPQVMAENIAPAIAQAMGPQDSVGLQSKREPSKGIGANTRLADLKPEQLKSLGGGASLESIAQAQPGTTVGELAPLLKNPPALESIAGLMQHRNDLKVGDFVSQDDKGRTRIDPSYKDPETMEMLKERNDITPSELSTMRQNFTKTLKNPELGKAAAKKSFDLMKKRPDLKPEDMGKMMDNFRQAAGGDEKGKQGAGDEAGAHAALDMFDSASKLMEKRSDLKPERVGEMAQSIGGMSSPEDKNGPRNVAEGFESASKSLEKNVLRGPEEMSRMASTVNDHFKGGDEKSAGHRMNAFKQSSEMMGDNTQMDHNSINTMLTQATERDPKIKNGEGPDRNKRLAGVMNDVATGVKQGTVPPTDLSAHFRNQDAEKAKFQPEKPKDDKKDKVEEQKDNKQPKTEGEDKKSAGDVGKAKGDSPNPTGDKAEAKSEAKAESKPEEEGPKPSLAPGEAPSVDKEAAAKAGPGEAAGVSTTGAPTSASPKVSQETTWKSPGVGVANPQAAPKRG